MGRRKDPAWNMSGSLPWLAVLCAIIAAVKPASASEPRVVCYYTNWSVYRPGTARFNPQNINPYLCTHLIYAFGGFTKDNTLKPFDKYQDIEKGGYAKFTGLKTYNKRLKTMLAIGGWNEGSSRFSPMVAAKDRRKEFVRNAIKFLRQNHFDGLDLDWEYPAFRDGGKPRDRDNYARLVRELRSEFDRESEKTGRPRLLLTMAVPAGIEYIQKGFDVQKLNQYLDWMNLLTYDYHSAFEPAVNHHSPLYPIEPPSEYSVDSELNIDYTIQFYLDNGADPDKLVLGIPTYGRSYTLYNQDATDIGAPADGPGEQGDATREKGYLAYYEICEGFKKKPKAKKPKEESEEDEDEDKEEDSEEEDPEEDLEWTIVQPNPDAMGPYAFRGNQWVGYDDIDIVKKKAEYVAEKGLGGIMFWSIDNDDFRGGCHGKPYPLIEAAKEALITKLGNTDNAIVSDKKSSSRSSSRQSNRNRQAVTTTTARTTTKSRTTTKKQSNLKSTTPVWKVQTPEPPTTPDPGTDFKCSDEGFFPHPRDCKKYFWCLDSGPSNLGIVANQFTCPSGLFFNKAADSCDFARNVVCKVKPITTTTTTTTTTTPTTTTPPRTTRVTTPYAPRLVSTSRRPPSRLSTLFQRLSGSTTTTTTTRTTSTEAPELEDEIAVEEPNLEVDSEDPQVIKELIDLIRKAGGVDQLEKQLNLAESNSGGKDTTPTPAAIPKNLFERVLGQKRQQSSFKYSARANQFKNTQPSAPGQNSRVGPQNQGLEDLPEVASLRKERPQYTSINRFRSSKATEAPEDEEPSELDSGGPVEEEDDEEVRVSSSKPFVPQYVNIRRARPTTSENPIDNDEEDSGTRFALFERNEPVAQYTSDDEGENDNNEPEYVTIRRQRLRNDDITTPKYQTIYRTRATPTETTQSIEEEIKLEETVLSKSSTEGTTQLPYVTLLRSRPTREPETSSEPEVYTDTRNEVTEPNDPDIITEAETEITTTRAIIANVQISTLLNNPTESVTSPSAAPVTEPATSPPTTATTSTTTTTTTTTAQTTKRLFPKRTRSTTVSPVTTEEPSTTTAKVSVERNYAFIRRTRPTTTVASVSNDTQSTVPSFTRLANDIPLEPENNAFGRQRNNRFNSVVRKIRSTTPNSREVSVNTDEADYGDKKPAVANRRRRPTFIKRVTDGESQIVSNGENGYLTRDDGSTPSSRSPHIRFRKVSTTTAIPSREDSVHEASEPKKISDDPPVLVRQRGRFRPTLSASDISSLTAVDTSEQYNFVPRGRSAQAIRRPIARQTPEPEEIDVDEQDLEHSEVEENPTRRPSVDLRSRSRSRFSTNEEARTETLEVIQTTRNDRKLSFPKFRPRPFTRPSAGSSTELEDEISSDDRVDNIVEDQLSTVALPPRGFPSRLRFTSTTTAVPSTGNRAHNPRIIINRNRSGLLSRRPATTTTTTEADDTDDVELRISDDIHLSETAIEEKEHDMSTEDETSEQPRKSIIVKKINPQGEDSTQSNENNETTSEKINNNEDDVNKLEEVGDKVKQRRVKVVFRRPSALSTPSSEVTLAETFSVIQETSTLATASSTPRIRRVIKKKIRPLATTVAEAPKTSTKSLEIVTTEGNTEEIMTTENTVPDNDVTTTQVDSDDLPSTEIPTNTSPETEEETTTITELVSSSTSTVAGPLTTLKPRFERPFYRPTRPFSVTSSTEAPSAFSSRSYSRKYNIGVYTSPSSSDKETSKLVTRRPLFTPRPFTRRPYTTVRSTTKRIDDEEEEDYYSDEVDEEQDDKLVFVPENQLFTRGPKESENDEEEDLYESYDEDERDEKENEEVEDNPFKVPPKRLPYVPKTINSNAFRTSSTTTTQAPRKLKANTNIYQNKNSNRTLIFRPSSDDSGKRAQNVPIGYTGSIKPNQANSTKYQVNNITETSEEKASTTTEYNEISTDFTTTEDDDYLSITDYTSTDASTNTGSSFNIVSTESEVASTTDEVSIPTEFTTPTDITEDDEYLEDIEATTETGFTSTVVENISTIGHVFAEVPSTKEDKTQTEAIPTTVTTTTPTPEPASIKTEEAPVFRTHFDKLFSVSRVVEVSSKQDKHRLNKNNESRLIETGEIMVEKKPTVDKIGEVNRFTLIKIVEEEIPIYLTKLSHSYPVENPPNNPITIDEARNARALNNSTDVGKESLVASESINEAYRQVNQLNNPNKTESVKKHFANPAERVVIEEKAIQIDEDGEEVNPLYLPLPMQWQFVPAAYESEKEKEKKILKQAKNFEIITPRPFKTEPSTLSLEALFKTENPELYTARKVGTDDSKKPNESQPFIVYAAPKSTPENSDGNIRKNNKLTNFVKLKFLKPDLSRSIKTYAKGQEFAGLSPSTEDTTIKYPVSITILESDKTQDVTTVRPVFTTISDEEINAEKTNPADIFSMWDTPTTINILSTTQPITPESSTENQPTTTDSTEATTDSTESSTLVSIITRGALSLNAKNRPKLTYPRRYQSKNSDITRISVSPLANSATTQRSLLKNNQTAPNSLKFNRTNNFSQGKSRFSSSRSQNVPVDLRVKKGKDIVRSYPKQANTTSEVLRIQPVSNTESSTRKLYFKPIRPSILRSPSFVPRKANTPPVPQAITKRRPFLRRPAPTTTTEPSADETTTSDIAEDVPTKPSFRGRGNSKFSLNRDKTTTEKQSTARPRRPYSKFTPNRAETKNATESEQSAPKSSRPTRVYARRRLAKPIGGDRDITNPTVREHIEVLNRRPTRIGFRRRVTVTTTTMLPPKTSTDTDQVVLESVGKEKEDATKFEDEEKTQKDYEENDDVALTEVTPTRKTIKLLKQPKIEKLPNISPDPEPLDEINEEDDIFPTDETTEENKRESKKFDATFNHNQLGDITKTESRNNNFESKEVNSDAAIAIAAHQLLSAALPSTLLYPEEDYDRPTDRIIPDPGLEAVHFTREYLMESPVTGTYNPDFQFLTTITPYTTTTFKPKKITKSPFKRISTTLRPPTQQPRVILSTSSRPRKVAPKRVQVYDKLPAVRKPQRTKIYDYDYYDEADQQAVDVDKYLDDSQVIVHAKGIIECLDQGNFPHPSSCKKFISCAKMENGGLIGWEYTCPKGLSYDPIGGICNWSAGLGCSES